MLEWTKSDRAFASTYGDDFVSEIIDRFNGLNHSAEMIDYLLETPDGWSCPRWEAIPVTKFGEVLKTIREAMEVKKYEYAVKFLHSKEFPQVDDSHFGDYKTAMDMASCWELECEIVRREVGVWEGIE